MFLPGESQGRRILVGCRLGGRTESDTTEETCSSSREFPGSPVVRTPCFQLFLCSLVLSGMNCLILTPDFFLKRKVLVSYLFIHPLLGATVLIFAYICCRCASNLLCPLPLFVFLLKLLCFHLYSCGLLRLRKPRM